MAQRCVQFLLVDPLLSLFPEMGEISASPHILFGQAFFSQEISGLGFLEDKL